MRLVIVDRDGVINEDSPDYVRSVDDLRVIDGSLEGLGLLTQAGFSIAVATNQSGIARGFFDVDTLNRMHGALCARAASVGARIDAFAFCPHGPADRCACRKPAAGLLITLARRFSVGLESTPFIGDSLRDLEAASTAGAIPILVRTGNGVATANALSGSLKAVRIYEDLRTAAAAIVSAR
jgi:D-glycero-D-manno-heptose 1,7-bisphosphate phosphatase